jgi:hypothetical protein
MRAPIRVTADGDVSGGGVARLLPGAGCDFPTAQVQAESIEVRIAGRRSDERLELRFGRKDIRPPGSQDLGGFFRTLPAMRLSIRERDGATARDTTRVDDQAGEVHLATTSLRLSG